MACVAMAVRPSTDVQQTQSQEQVYKNTILCVLSAICAERESLPRDSFKTKSLSGESMTVLKRKRTGNLPEVDALWTWMSQDLVPRMMEGSLSKFVFAFLTPEEHKLIEAYELSVIYLDQSHVTTHEAHDLINRSLTPVLHFVKQRSGGLIIPADHVMAMKMYLRNAPETKDKPEPEPCQYSFSDVEESEDNSSVSFTNQKKLGDISCSKCRVEVRVMTDDKMLVPTQVGSQDDVCKIDRSTQVQPDSEPQVLTQQSDSKRQKPLAPKFSEPSTSQGMGWY